MQTGPKDLAFLSGVPYSQGVQQGDKGIHHHTASVPPVARLQVHSLLLAPPGAPPAPTIKKKF